MDKRTAAMAVAVLVAAGCTSSPIAAPTPSPSPTNPTIAQSPTSPPPIPAGLSGEEWKLTTTVASIAWPKDCELPSLPVGATVDWWLLVNRSGTSVTFLYDIHNYPTDSTGFVGSVSGSDFTATSNDWPQPRLCVGSSLSWRSAAVTGRFSDDGAALNATEVWSYYSPASGETFSFSNSWTAHRVMQATTSSDLHSTFEERLVSP